MLIHIVCWKYKPGVTPEQREEHIARLRALDHRHMIGELAQARELSPAPVEPGATSSLLASKVPVAPAPAAELGVERSSGSFVGHLIFHAICRVPLCTFSGTLASGVGKDSRC